jgi:hypothetical protein
MAPKIKWVKHPMSDDLEPPEIHWLIAQLVAINKKGCTDAVILKHARHIFGVWSLCGHSDNIGYRIKGKTRLRAERVKATRGAKNDLVRLLATAESGSDKVFQKAWLAVSGKTRGLVWSPAPPPIIERKYDETGKLVSFRRERFDASKLNPLKVERFYALIPTAADALPLIEAAICKLEDTPAAERRKRKQDDPNDLAAIEDELAIAVRVAYREATGRKGLTWNYTKGKFEGGLINLGRNIDARLGTKVFTLNRMRKNISIGLKTKKATGA